MVNESADDKQEGKVLNNSTEPVIYTKREKEVLRLIADGLLSKEIAIKLNLSYYTVQNHRQNMLRKAKTKNFSELIWNAVNSGDVL